MGAAAVVGTGEAENGAGPPGRLDDRQATPAAPCGG